MIYLPKAPGFIPMFLLMSSETHTSDLPQLISISTHLMVTIYCDSTIHKIKATSLVLCSPKDICRVLVGDLISAGKKKSFYACFRAAVL